MYICILRVYIYIFLSRVNRIRIIKMIFIITIIINIYSAYRHTRVHVPAMMPVVIRSDRSMIPLLGPIVRSPTARIVSIACWCLGSISIFCRFRRRRGTRGGGGGGSPARLYKAPTDYTKPQQTIQRHKVLTKYSQKIKSMTKTCLLFERHV